MKKIVSIVLTIMTLVLALNFVACDQNQTATKGEVEVVYYEKAENLIPLLKTGKENIALLPEPAATKLTKIASDKTWYRLDLQELYDSQTKTYPQAVMMVKESVIKSYPNLVSDIESKFAENISWTKSNIEQGVNAINNKIGEGVTKSLTANDITEQVIDNCKIYWQSANDSKESVKQYIDGIIDVGAVLDVAPAVKVNDDFFYQPLEEQKGVFDKITVSVPDGAPALSIAKFINDNENFGTGVNFEYNVVDATKIGAIMQKGNADIMIIPVNGASKLYNKNGQSPYRMVSVVTHGNLYIVSDSQIKIDDLVGKKMGVIGQGLVPDLTLKVVLNKNGIKVK